MPARLSITQAQRDALLALPDTEDAFVRHYELGVKDRAAVKQCRTPETKLAFGLQLCVLRYPGRVLQRAEVVPEGLIAFVADQVKVAPEAIDGFARRLPTRYDQLTTLRRIYGFTDPTDTTKAGLKSWLAPVALKSIDGLSVVTALIEEMRQRRIIIPGVSVVERMAAEAMHAADQEVARQVSALLTRAQVTAVDALLADKSNGFQSRFRWLQEPPGKVGGRGFIEIMDRLDAVRAVGFAALDLPAPFAARLAQMAREGVRFTAQALQQMTPPRRCTVMAATLREIEIGLVDDALTMFESLIGRAYNNAKSRFEEARANQDDDVKARLIRVANVLDALIAAHTAKADIASAVLAVAPLETIGADARELRRSTRKDRGEILAELQREYRTFKLIWPRLLNAFKFESRASMSSLLEAVALLKERGTDTTKSLPATAPKDFIESAWRRYVFGKDGVDQRYYALAVFFALGSALRSGDVWVTGSKSHRSIETYLTPPPTAPATPARLPTPPVLTAAAYLADRMPLLDARLLETANRLERGAIQGAELVSHKVKLKKPAAVDDPEVKALMRRAYRLLPNVRLTDLLEDVHSWTGFLDEFRHLQTGKPIEDKRAFLAALIAEATNIGLGRMADICRAASRRTLTTISIWHMREETYRAALARIVEAQHSEPVAASFGAGQVSTSDGQHFYLGGEGEAAGEVNAHYGRDAIVKLYTHISDRYAPFHVKVITGTSGEAIHVLDGIVNHDSAIDISAHHTDGGGASDHVFAAMYLLGIKFQPRMPSLKERKLYAFEPRSKYGVLTPFIGERLDRRLIENNWDDVQRLVTAIRDRTVAPSLILRKLGNTPRQSGLSLAMREIGRIERTFHGLNWIEEPDLRRGTTEELNKGEARNSLSRAVSLYRQGRFRDRSFERQSHRAAALNLVTACIGLFNSRYIGRCLAELRRQQVKFDEQHIRRLSPLGWDHINLTGDYVWTENPTFDLDGMRRLNLNGRDGSSR